MSDYTLEWDDAMIARLTDEAVEAGLRNGASTLRDEAVARTPEDTGELVDSAGFDVEGDEASVFFGTDHAIAVHERLNVHHTNGQAKFLESALVSEEVMILDSIGNAMARVIDRG